MYLLHLTRVEVEWMVFFINPQRLRLDQVMNEDVLHDLEEGCNL